MNFLYIFLSASIINKFESNNTKCHELMPRNGEIGAFKYVGVKKQGLKVMPWTKVPFNIFQVFNSQSWLHQRDITNQMSKFGYTAWTKNTINFPKSKYRPIASSALQHSIKYISDFRILNISNLIFQYIKNQYTQNCNERLTWSSWIQCHLN